MRSLLFRADIRCSVTDNTKSRVRVRVCCLLRSMPQTCRRSRKPNRTFAQAIIQRLAHAIRGVRSGVRKMRRARCCFPGAAQPSRWLPCPDRPVWRPRCWRSRSSPPTSFPPPMRPLRPRRSFSGQGRGRLRPPCLAPPPLAGSAGRPSPRSATVRSPAARGPCAAGRRPPRRCSASTRHLLRSEPPASPRAVGSASKLERSLQIDK